MSTAKHNNYVVYLIIILLYIKSKILGPEPMDYKVLFINSLHSFCMPVMYLYNYHC